MILLDVKSYCHDCPMFKPTNEVVCASDTHKDVYVRCTNHIPCNLAERHIEKSKMEEQKKDMPKKIGY